jgi:hypothetical protein
MRHWSERNSACPFAAPHHCDYDLGTKEYSMALPIVPIAVVAAKYGGVALAAYQVARRVHRGHTDQQVEDALDDLPDGISVHKPRDRAQTNVGFRFKRVFRASRTGKGLEVDITTLTRIRFRKVA